MKKGQHQRPHVRRLKKTGTQFTAGQQRTVTKYDRYIRQLGAMINRPQYVYPISLPLRGALREIRRALIDGDISLAADLTRVKSFIAGDSDESSPNMFWESGKDHRIYGYLDSLHFELSMDAGKMPGSMMAMHSDGTVTLAPPVQPNSQTLKRILHEQTRMDLESRERMEKSNLPGVVNAQSYWVSGRLLWGDPKGNSIWRDVDKRIVVQYDKGYKSQYPTRTASGQLSWDSLDVPKELRKRAAVFMDAFDRW